MKRKEFENNIFTMDTTSCSMTISPPNKYHKDDIIDKFLQYVRYTELESDAISNISVILKTYERKKQYSFKEELSILFK